MFSVSHSSRWAIVAIMAAVGGGVSGFHAEAADLVVRYDQSQLIRLPRPVSEVIIGNPSIADVNVQGGNLLVVTGKTFGVTNIIALDADKNVIQDQRVIVEQDDRRTVVVYRGSLRHSLHLRADVLAGHRRRRRARVLRRHDQSCAGQGGGVGAGQNATAPAERVRIAWARD